MATEVATAARVTLASGTARVWHRSFLDPPVPRLGAFVTTQEGMADLVRRRMRMELEGPAEVDEWAARLLARFPWLGDEGENDERSRPVVVYTGTRSFLHLADRWMAEGNGEDEPHTRSRRDPLWIVEVLEHADEAIARGEEIVRDASCRRWEFRVDPALHPEISASGWKRRPLRLAGDAWIDDEGRLRRVTWTRLRRRRSRWPKRAAPVAQAWQTTELWDFGLPVAIEVPIVGPEPSPPWPRGLLGFASKLWRRRRAYERRRRRGLARPGSAGDGEAGGAG
jgi:hypothetical protein